MRSLIKAALKKANLGALPNKRLLTATGAERTLEQRMAVTMAGVLPLLGGAPAEGCSLRRAARRTAANEPRRVGELCNQGGGTPHGAAGSAAPTTPRRGMGFANRPRLAARQAAWYACAKWSSSTPSMNLIAAEIGPRVIGSRFELIHVSGVSNCEADALSRLCQSKALPLHLERVRRELPRSETQTSSSPGPKSTPREVAGLGCRSRPHSAGPHAAHCSLRSGSSAAHCRAFCHTLQGQDRQPRFRRLGFDTASRNASRRL